MQETQREPIRIEVEPGAEGLNDPGDDLPRFEEGEVLTLKGWPFELVRVNASTLALKPLLPDGVTSTRRFLARMT